MLKSKRLFNISISDLSMEETLHEIEKSINKNHKIHYADLNAEKVVILQTEQDLIKIYEETDIVNLDGQAVFWAAKILNNPVKERIAGVDLMDNVINIAAKKKYKVYLLGAQEEVLLKLVNIYRNKFGVDFIAGYRNGYFNLQDEEEIINDINKSEAQILFVGITSPKKELFLSRNKNSLNSVNFAMGVGGSFDVFAGKVKRAPVWMQKIGMEWFYRVIQEPKRMWKRYLIGNSKFILLLIKSKLKNNH